MHLFGYGTPPPPVLISLPDFHLAFYGRLCCHFLGFLTERSTRGWLLPTLHCPALERGEEGCKVFSFGLQKRQYSLGLLLHYGPVQEVKGFLCIEQIQNIDSRCLVVSGSLAKCILAEVPVDSAR